VDITYYDSGYIDPNYYVYTAEAFVDLGEFIVEDYLDADYFENTGVRITLTCDAIKITIVPASADLVANFSQSVNGVIDVRAEVTLTSIANLASQEIRVREFNADLTTTATQSTLASATLSPQVSFSSIASQLTVAFQNATGTITMETVVTLTATVGVIKEFSNFINLGIRTGSPHLGISVTPTFGVNSRFNTWTMSIWVRRDTNTGTAQPIVSTRIEAGAVNHAAFVFVGTNIQTRFNFDADEPEAVWTNVAPTDGLWHHYLIRTVFRQGADYGSNAGSASHWRLWIDGVAQGQTSSGYFAAGQMTWNDSYGGSANYNGVNLGHGIVANFTGGYDLTGRTLDGAVAQLWMSYVNDADFNPTDFYDGYLDFGTNGTRNGILTTPLIYIPLEPTYTDLGVGVTDIYSVPAWSGEYLKYTTTKAEFTATAQPEAVLLVVAHLQSEFNAIVDATKNVGIVAALSTEFTIVADNQTLRLAQADLSTESQLVCLVTVQRSSAVELTAQTTATIDLTRIFAGTVDLSSAFTVIATIGEVTQFNISLDSVFTQATEISRTRNLASAQESVSTLTAQIDDRLRDQSVSLETAATLTITYTRIPAISATLTSEFALSGEAEKLVVAFGTLTVIFTQTSTAFKVVIAQATLVVEAFELTQGDILNFDPCREISVESETRAAKILPESRLLIVESETRTLKVPQETRVLRVDYETRVNTIKC
jgi:hypothetical protein